MECEHTHYLIPNLQSSFGFTSKAKAKMSSTLSFQIAAALMGYIIPFPVPQQPQPRLNPQPKPNQTTTIHTPPHSSAKGNRTPRSPRRTPSQHSHHLSGEGNGEQRGEGRRSTETTPLLSGQVMHTGAVAVAVSVSRGENGCERGGRVRVVWPLLGSLCGGGEVDWVAYLGFD